MVVLVTCFFEDRVGASGYFVMGILVEISCVCVCLEMLARPGMVRFVASLGGSFGEREERFE